MAAYKVEALVLGVHNWGEADKMVTLFTRERGKVKAAAFGSRRTKSPLAAGMQMFSHLEVALQEGAKLDTVKQCSLLHRYRKLSEDLLVMAYGSVIAELVRELFPERAADQGVFELLLEVFSAFERRNPRLTALVGAWQLLARAGLGLHLERCLHCGREIAGDSFLDLEEGGVLCEDCHTSGIRKLAAEGRGFLLSVLSLDWKNSEGIRVRRENLLMAEQVLLMYLQGMMGKPLKSLDFLRQL